jgi:hypothetical protein
MYLLWSFPCIFDRMGGIMVCVLTSSAVDDEFELPSGQTKDYKIVASSLSTQHLGEREMTGWLGIRIMCQSGATCLPADCCFSGLAL